MAPPPPPSPSPSSQPSLRQQQRQVPLNAQQAEEVGVFPQPTVSVTTTVSAQFNGEPIVTSVATISSSSSSTLHTTTTTISATIDADEPPAFVITAVQPQPSVSASPIGDVVGGAGGVRGVRPPKRLAKELAPCRAVLDALDSHADAWPFLLPVNTKQFPTYRRVIKAPIDLSTIRRRLADGGYRTRDEFGADVRQIFVNCETFNEDDSPVGQAGHRMREFFEMRWMELCGGDTSSGVAASS